MILFENDWSRYPTAKIHANTKNKSFLRQAEIYRMMGVKNYAFHLTLLQPELEYVDPHDPNISADVMMTIAKECLYNPWYFFREALRIPPQASRESLPFRANRGNLSLLWLFFNHVTTALIQPRQTGKSVSTDGLMLWLLVCGSTNTRINMLTLNDRLRTSNVNRIKKMRAYLPYYLRAPHREDSDNQHEITCKVKDNLYSSAVAQGSEAAALTVARGLTAPIAHVDEFAFIDYIHKALPAMLSAGNAAREEAAAFDVPYGTIFTTTAGMRDTPSGKYAYDTIHGGATWTEKMFDCKHRQDLIDMIEKNKVNKKSMTLVNITMSHRQLGVSDEKHAKNMQDTGSVGEDADRDYFNIWTSGGITNPISPKLLERIRASMREAEYNQITDLNYILRWHIPEKEIERRMATGKFILGVDCSEGIGRDSITMVLTDVRNLQTVAAGNINEINVVRLLDFIADFMVRYPNVTLIPERRSTGIVLIDTLLIKLPALGIDPYKRIYNRIVDEPTKYVDEWKLLQYDMSRRPYGFDERNKELFGFVTSGSGRHGRDQLYSHSLQRGASMGCDGVIDPVLCAELAGLAMKNGRIDHSQSGHDDMVIAWLLNTWFLTMARNLKHYGITDALSEAVEYREGVVVRKKAETPEDVYVQTQQQELRDEMESLLEQLKSTNDDRISIMLEKRIKTLDSRLIERFTDTQSIDGLINEARNARNKHMRERMQNRNVGTWTAPQPYRASVGQSWSRR